VHGTKHRHLQLPVPPETTVAEFEVDLGAVVVVVVAAAVPVVAAEAPDDPDELDEEAPVPDVDDVEGDVARVVVAFAVVPGISLETTSPKPAAAPVATITTARDVRRTLAPARSLLLAPSSPGRASSGRPLGGFGCSMAASRLVGMLTEACHHAKLSALAQSARSPL
jgi:hypothetical protein